MGVRTRLVVASLVVGVGVVLGLIACMGGWFNPQLAATLIIGNPVAKGGNFEVLISVVNMPDEGLSGIQFGTVGNEALTFTNVDTTTVVATGSNGFTVTAQQYTAPNKGCLLAVNPPTGVGGGSIVKLTFQATAANPTVAVDKTKAKLFSHQNTWITTWNLETGKKYYAK